MDYMAVYTDGLLVHGLTGYAFVHEGQTGLLLLARQLYCHHTAKLYAI